jgi:hypothetical protein
MVKIRGMVSDDELDDLEREALAKEPTKFQKGRKAKIVDIFLKIILNLTMKRFHSLLISR